MQAESTVARVAAALSLAVGATASFPLYSQDIGYPPMPWTVVSPPPFALGVASGAQFGAQVSAANPTIRCIGGRSLSCGAHFDPRPILAGALIGGLLGALSRPAYYHSPFVPLAGSLQRTPEPQLVNSGHGAWIADSWQPFGNPGSDSIEKNRATGAQFVERWQQFFEPAR
jgi:hypothetical protein